MDEKRKLKRIIKEKGSRGNSEYEQWLHFELKKGNDSAVQVMLMRVASDQDEWILKTRNRMFRIVENLKLAIERCDFRHWKRNLDRLRAERTILAEKLDEWMKKTRFESGEKG